jgi:hypothetical protein
MINVFLKTKCKAYTWDADQKNTDALIAELAADKIEAKVFTTSNKGLVITAMELYNIDSTLEIFPGEWAVVFPTGAIQPFNSEDFHSTFKAVADK